jgi:tRNA A37 threonylcarbamoyladenosine modification protein TsaB
MSLLLAVESTSGRYAVAAGRPGEPLAHQASRRDEPGFEGLGKLAGSALASLGAAVADLDELAVDVGPGNLSSVRAAVAYVNGLAFSLGIKVFCANSLELLAASRDPAVPLPVLCMRKASGGNAYLGLFDSSRPPQLAYGQLGTTVAALCGHLKTLAVAGGPADVIAGLLPAATVHDARVDHPSVDVLYQIARSSGGQAGRIVGMAHPLNEGSPVFHEQAVPGSQ